MGETPEGGGPPTTVKAVTEVAVPLGVITEIGPVVAPGGTVAVIRVTEFTVNVAVTLLNMTAVAPKKSVPVIVTIVPMGPEVGVNDVMVGACARALGNPKYIKAAAETTIKMTRIIRFITDTPLGAGWSQSAAAGGGARDRGG
jgi:hypothetical protein